MARKAQMEFEAHEAEVIFENFSGREGKYGTERRFSIILEPEAARALEAEQWPVKWPKPGEEDEENENDGRNPTIPIALRFDILPPHIEMWTPSNGIYTVLDEHSVGVLDSMDILHADVKVRARWWDDKGTWRIKCYLKKAYIAIDEDELDLKHAAIKAEYAAKHQIEVDS